MAAASIPVPTSLKRNVTAGWISAAISAALGLAIVPVQLHFLGTETYGLIGFCVTLQSVLLLLDMGMTATVNREVARCVSQADVARVSGLLGALEWLSWGLALACVVAVGGLSPALAANWLNVVNLRIDEVTDALAIAGVLVALRWPISLHQSVLLGAQRAVLNSQINVVATAASAAAGVAVLAWVAPDVRWFMASQVLIAAVHLIALRFAGRRVLGLAGRWDADFGALRRIWRFSALTGLLTAIGVFFMQMDKLLLSNLLSLEEFGQYSLAAVVASGLYVVTMPVFNAMYPRFSALLAAGDTDELERLYRFSSQLLAALLAPIGVVIALFSQDLLRAWTSNDALSAEAAPLVSLLVLGSALHGMMFIPYALTLARGAAGLALRINVVLLILVGPMIFAGATLWHATGAAAAWLLLQFLYLTAGSYATHRILLPHMRYRWLLNDVGVPVAWAGVLGIAGAQLAAWLHMPWPAKIIFAALLLAVCGAAAFASCSHLWLWASGRPAKA